jgi:deoxycytidine triphosphate deaminase
MTGHPNQMNVWLAGMGLAVRSVEKFVPECVFKAPRLSIARFLRALFSGDGSVSTSRQGNVLVEYASSSERLIRDVQHLLLRFGIIARLRRKITNYGTTAFILNITDKDAISKFGKEIGFIPDSMKDRRLQDTLEFIRRFPKRKSNFDTIPSEGWVLLKQACYRHGHSMLSLGVNPAWGQSVARSKFVKLGELLNEADLLEIGQSHILWDTLESIKLAGKEPVYDLSVASTNNFIANDFIVHNSTYARSGLIVNTTPLEPGWRGRLVLEFSNSADLPVRIYANEGIAQVTFFESDEDCETSYADRSGKYQNQTGLVTPRL